MLSSLAALHGNEGDKLGTGLLLEELTFVRVYSGQRAVEVLGCGLWSSVGQNKLPIIIIIHTRVW